MSQPDQKIIHAAGIMFLTDSGETLLLKRSPTSDMAGTWAFPGGHVEDGETPLEAAERECEEEIGFSPGGEARYWTRRIAPSVVPESDEMVDYTTFIKRVDGKFKPHLNHEHSDYAWVHVSKVLPHDSKEPVQGKEIVR
jgi:8-oxo-dGTP pyrophosphatase MutT (NUDIX family)